MNNRVGFTILSRWRKLVFMIAKRKELKLAAYLIVQLKKAIHGTSCVLFMLKVFDFKKIGAIHNLLFLNRRSAMRLAVSPSPTHVCEEA